MLSSSRRPRVSRSVAFAIVGLGLALALSACGGGGGSSRGAAPGAGSAPTTGPGAGAGTAGPGSTPPGSTGPNGFSVLAIDPADGATGVPTDVVVRIDFNAELNPGSVHPQSVEIVGPAGAVDAAIAFAGSTAITLTPRAPLDPGAPYTVNASRFILDTSNRPLGVDVASGFETGPGPAGTTPPTTGPPGPITLRAGAGSADVTPVVGVPLGGFNEGDRRNFPPDLDPTNYHTLFRPSTGVLDPIMCKALVLESGGDRVVIMTLDVVATTADAVRGTQQVLAARGITIPVESILAVSSHTHSGPGTISSLHFWELIAMDLYQPQVYQRFIEGCADAIEAAIADLGPAVFGADSIDVTGVTRNRRSRDSNVFTRDSIDPELGVIKIDRPDGTPVATVWNYACHGLIYWHNNMEYSADLFGHVAREVESRGGGLCLFANGAEGDITPDGRGAADGDRLGRQLADEILALRGATATTGQVDLRNSSEWVDYGNARLGIDLNRLGRSNSGSSIIQALLRIPGIGSLGIGISLNGSWIENRHRFQAVRINDVAIASIPGEAIHTVGLAIKASGQALGYRKTFAFGLANSHMSYITTPEEYDAGGYESLATFFGRSTGTTVIDEAGRRLDAVRN